MRALVVDDSRAMRRIICGIIESIGFEVLTAEYGRAALEVLADTKNIQVAFVDWNMPHMDGLELVRSLRRQPQFQNLRILMVTTEIDMARVAEALDAGADEYVMKPFTKEVVLEKLQLLGFSTYSGNVVV